MCIRDSLDTLTGANRSDREAGNDELRRQASLKHCYVNISHRNNGAETCLPALAATTQTTANEMCDTDGRTQGVKPFRLGQDHALAATSEAVRRYYPCQFRSNKTGTPFHKEKCRPPINA